MARGSSNNFVSEAGEVAVENARRFAAIGDQKGYAHEKLSLQAYVGKGCLCGVLAFRVVDGKGSNAKGATHGTGTQHRHREIF